MKVDIAGETSFYYFDVNSKLLIQQETSKDVQGKIMTELTILKNYKEFDGIKFPTLLKVQAGPQTMDMNIKSVVVNKNVKAGDFK